MPFSCAASSASAIWRAIASACGRAGAALEAIGERRPFDQLENQRRDAVGVFQAVDRADVRVIECRERPRFAREAGTAFWIGDEMWRQDLNRHVASELAVAGAIDLAHAAGAERRHDRVGPEPAIDHRSRPRRNRGDGNRRTLEKMGRCGLEREQRLHFLPQRLVSVARLDQKRGALLRRPGQRAVVEVRNQIAAFMRHQGAFG